MVLKIYNPPYTSNHSHKTSLKCVSGFFFLRARDLWCSVLVWVSITYEFELDSDKYSKLKFYLNDILTKYWEINWDRVTMIWYFDQSKKQKEKSGYFSVCVCVHAGQCLRSMEFSFIFCFCMDKWIFGGKLFLLKNKKFVGLSFSKSYGTIYKPEKWTPHSLTIGAWRVVAGSFQTFEVDRTEWNEGRAGCLH